MPLFKSAYDALRFAYNFNGNNCVIAHLGVPPAPTGKGLGGLDGAAEAGNIKRIVKSLGEVAECFIIARFAPARIPCSCHRSCCRGWDYNKEWRKAVVRLANEIRFTCFGGAGNVGYRTSITSQYFLREQERESIEAIAAIGHVHKVTAYRHFKAVRSTFRGTKTRKGVEQNYLDLIEVELRKAGIVGEEE